MGSEMCIRDRTICVQKWAHETFGENPHEIRGGGLLSGQLATVWIGRLFRRLKAVSERIFRDRAGPAELSRLVTEDIYKHSLK